MKKLLYITNIAGKRFSYSFCGSALEACKESNIEFMGVANRSKATAEDVKLDEEKYGIKLFHFDLARSPFSLGNLKAYKQLVKIIRDNDIDYIHCNTPVGGMLGRLAGKKCKVESVIYQAHGFHFYKGAPFINRLLYYPIERFLAHFTDALITINKEDFEAAKKMKLRKGGSAYLVHGVGMDTASYTANNADRAAKRAELGLGDADVVIVSVGELIKRKNYETAIKAIASANDSHLHYFICGTGVELEDLKAFAAEQKVSEQVHFLGFRTDVKEILAASDIFMLTSYQEGLARSMMEAMASGLPCIASRIRGNIDLIEDGVNGFLCTVTDANAVCDAINKLAAEPDMRERMGKANLEAIKRYDISIVKDELNNIYLKEFKGK